MRAALILWTGWSEAAIAPIISTDAARPSSSTLMLCATAASTAGADVCFLSSYKSGKVPK